MRTQISQGPISQSNFFSGTHFNLFRSGTRRSNLARVLITLLVLSVNIVAAKGAPGTALSIAATPAAVNFGNVPDGSANSQTISIKNRATSPVTITAVNTSTAVFTVTGLTLPSTVQPNKCVTLNVVFSPSATATVSASASIISAGGTLQIPLRGTGIKATQLLSVSSTSLNFGNVAVGIPASQSVTLTSTGNSSVTLSGVSVSGAGISVTGISNATVLNPGQTAAASVQFAPTTSGAISGSINIASNATNSPAVITVTGTGIVSYSVALAWQASVSQNVTGYNVYRSVVSGGPYNQIASSVNTLSYNDTTVAANLEYFYVVTSLGSGGMESSYSSQISATIP